MLETDYDFGREPGEVRAGKAKGFLLSDEGDVLFDGLEEILAEHGFVLADIEPSESVKGFDLDGDRGQVVMGDIQYGKIAEFRKGSVLDFADVVVGDVEAEGGGVFGELVGNFVYRSVGDREG